MSDIVISQNTILDILRAIPNEIMDQSEDFVLSGFFGLAKSLILTLDYFVREDRRDEAMLLLGELIDIIGRSNTDVEEEDQELTDRFHHAITQLRERIKMGTDHD